MWSLKSGRLTRSHCHGWSAAPTFFLSSVTLGVRPLQPGFAEIAFSPQLGDLAFMRGTVPTPHGPIEVQCRHRGKKLEKILRLPKGVKLRAS
jgi:alpha-L-rhamnosidase